MSSSLPASIDSNLDSSYISSLYSSRGFKLGCLNIASLPKHIDELRVFLADFPLHVLCVNETRLDSTVKDSDIHIVGYEIVRRDRVVNGRHGGGVCFYIRNSINYLIRSDLNIDVLENLCIEIRQPNAKPFLVVTWYRPPDSHVELFAKFESLIGKLDSESLEVYLLGDLNCNLASPLFDNNATLLTNVADIYGLHQLINEPTRCTASTSTLIDLIYTNCPERVVCSGVSHLSISDHSLIFVVRKLVTDQTPRGHTYITYRKFENFSITNFRDDISQQNWSIINNFLDPNDMWAAWKNLFLECVDKHAPIRSKRIRPNRSPWITPILKKRFRKRNVLKIKAIHSNNASDWSIYKKFKNSVTDEIRKAKEIYYVNSLNDSKGNPRDTWKIINNLMSRRSINPSIKEIKVNGVSVHDREGLSSAFNDHFSSIGPKLANSIPKINHCNSFLDYIDETNARFELTTTNASVVQLMLSKLCKSKATGLDDISARFLRECCDLIAPSLSIIFNRSIVTGIFPDEWKLSKVFPLFKQGNRSDLDNYRPISVIPIVAKVFERIVYDQLYEYLIENNLLSSRQSGFRSLHSTVTALLEATDSWAYDIDAGNVNAVVFLDLKKAFDTVDHSILLSKMEKYGLSGSTLSWFQSYLNQRKQRCFVNGSLSSCCSLSCGIPQGTMLGPLLFILYINDLPNCLISSSSRMYADDTHITFASNNIKTIEENLNEDLSKVNEWLVSNKLTLNSSKTEFLLIGSRQRLATLTSPAITINGSRIKQVMSSKSLGVIIDQNMTWDAHISFICKKIASGIGALKRVRPFVPFETFLTIYDSLIRPHFEYCSVVWSSCNKNLSEKLQKLQNRAARIISHSSYDTNANLIFKRLGWLNLATQREIDKVTMVYKSLHGLVPNYLCTRFVERNVKYSIRDIDNKLALSKPRSNFLKNTFQYSGAALWNSLPAEIRSMNSLRDFKLHLKNLYKSSLFESD